MTFPEHEGPGYTLELQPFHWFIRLGVKHSRCPSEENDGLQEQILTQSICFFRLFHYNSLPVLKSLDNRE